MLKRLTTLALAALLLHAFDALPLAAAARPLQKPPPVERVKANVAKRAGEKQRVTVEMQDGSKLKGHIGEAGEDSFTLTDAKSGQATTLNYRDVSKVKGQGMATWKKFAIGGTVAAVGAAAVIAYAITHTDVLGDGPIFQ
jgi:hypothetical protein